MEKLRLATIIILFMYFLFNSFISGYYVRKYKVERNIKHFTGLILLCIILLFFASPLCFYRELAKLKITKFLK